MSHLHRARPSPSRFGRRRRSDRGAEHDGDRAFAYHRRMDARETAPSAERNKQPILAVLARVLPPRGLVLEVGSGTGQHVAHFAKALPALTFQPSEMDVERHASIEAWTAAGKLSNVKPPLAIDVTQRPWPVSAADAVVCINVIHISPWEATQALMAGAGRILPPPRG